jgi:hypothetical protein
MLNAMRNFMTKLKAFRGTVSAIWLEIVLYEFSFIVRVRNEKRFQWEILALWEVLLS